MVKIALVGGRYDGANSHAPNGAVYVEFDGDVWYKDTGKKNSRGEYVFKPTNERPPKGK